MNRCTWRQILVALVVLVLIPLCLRIPEQYLSAISDPKDVRICMLTSLFTLLGYSIISIFRIMENRDSLVFQKKFDHYQKYLNTLAKLMNKGEASQSDLVEMQQQYANITILMNQDNPKALHEVMTQTAKILWHICEAQEKNKKGYGKRPVSDVNFFRHFNMIARAMQSDIHDCKYKKRAKQDGLLVEMFSKDILGAMRAQESTCFNNFSDADFLLSQISPERKDKFNRDYLDLDSLGKVIYSKHSKNSQGGFLWKSTNNVKPCYLKWRKNAGSNLCVHIGGSLSHDYSWFIPCKKNMLVQRTHFLQTKKRLFILLDIMYKQFRAYEMISDFIIQCNNEGDWNVLLWEYDTVYIQAKNKKHNAEEYGTHFIDVTYNYIDDEYVVSMGCRIEESDMNWFDEIASCLETKGIFNYHRELRRGYFKVGMKSPEELKPILNFCLETMGDYTEEEFPFPYEKANRIWSIELLSRAYENRK